MYSLYLYFLGLRNTSNVLEPFKNQRSHVAIWDWIRMCGMYPLWIISCSTSLE